MNGEISVEGELTARQLNNLRAGLPLAGPAITPPAPKAPAPTSTRTMRTLPMRRLSPAPRRPGAKGATTSYGLKDALLGGIGGFITGGVGGAVAGAAAGLTRGGPSAPPAGIPGPSAPPGTGLVGGTGCRPPAIRVAGRCVDPTASLPGGRPFISEPTTAAFGPAVVGSFGIPALEPAVVGSIQGRPIRRCPPGAVLGKDDLCYMKGSIPRKFRKHPPRAKPPVSAYDAKMMRKYGQGGSKQARVKKLAQEAGYSCKRK